MNKILRNVIATASFISMIGWCGGALAAVSSFSIDGYPGIAKWNALGLAVDPTTGNAYVTSLSFGGEDNLYAFTPNGSLIFSKRVSLEPVLTDAVVADSGDLYVVSSTSIAKLNGNGEVLSTFPIDQWPVYSGLGYISPANEFLTINYSNRNNPVINKLGLNGAIVATNPLADPYLALDGGFTIGSAYNPLTHSIFTSYFNETGQDGYDHVLAEYTLGADGQYHVSSRYDLASAGIASHILALDIDRSNGMFYLQENNSQIVKLGLSDLSLLAPAPEPETYALMLAGLGVMSVMIRRRNDAKV